RERAEARGLVLSDRLDAQSVVWCMTNWPTPEEWPAEDREAFDRYRQTPPDEAEEQFEIMPEEPEEPAQSSTRDPLVSLAEELLIDHAALKQIADMLRSKGQIVFYGPPGTGKTYV